MEAPTAPIRLRIRVEGIVQGIGFRPFVASLAARLGLAGLVGNDSGGVFVEIEGPPAAVDGFRRALVDDAPPLALIEWVHAEEMVPQGHDGFKIVASEIGPERRALISPDTATCDDCLRELFDPGDRRFRYPFINCTNCGPRFTIVRDVPYDRPFTTMAPFRMCEACSHEYHDPQDRRFHAQPICCPGCGPSLRLLGADGTPIDGDPIAGAVAHVASGAVVAVKGLGGYHLAAEAGSELAVARLRSRKHREDKPFAVMAPDRSWAMRLGTLSQADERILSGARRPIVLVPKAYDAPLAPSVAPGNRNVGLMLPYTPLHQLLARGLERPFVLTSGNVSAEPIAYRDEDAFERLAGIADAFLVHDRAIHMRTDDSVVRTFRDREMLLRRSRGWVPQPVSMPDPFPRPVLACGAELKNTFCVAKGRRAFVSQHVGDLENYETLRSYEEGIAHLRRLFDVQPEVVVHDLHPEYLSTKYAAELDDVPLVGVQHHHAHIASCLADNGRDGPVIGIAFDGLGFGTDGTIWGGEFLIADLVEFERVGSFEPVPLPGGEAAIRAPWRMAAAYLDRAFEGAPPEELPMLARNGSWPDVLEVARRGVNSPHTSSAGRLFDAVAALLDVRDEINYEGQAAVELEQLADPSETVAYAADITDSDRLRVQGADLVRASVLDLLTGSDRSSIAARFHNGVADASVRLAERLRERTGLGTVALSGGVFQNALLLARLVDGLEGSGFAVLLHGRVPPNDGGISLGQAAVAGARDRARS